MTPRTPFGYYCIDSIGLFKPGSDFAQAFARFIWVIVSPFKITNFACWYLTIFSRLLSTRGQAGNTIVIDD
jgi:hypothetical protein